jgi:phosphoribosylaminoimidazolecarboxamide formyltransferase/IMP cyclohydrolase
MPCWPNCGHRAAGGAEDEVEPAKKAFALTAKYDAAITARLARIEVEEGVFADKESALPAALHILAPRKQSLRYGENPHQQASLYGHGEAGVANGKQLQGKELSYNNLVDLDAAGNWCASLKARRR